MVLLSLMTFLLLIGYGNDLYHFDPTLAIWSSLSFPGDVPSPRYGMGLTVTADNTLYLFGGLDQGEVEVVESLLLIARSI